MYAVKPANGEPTVNVGEVVIAKLMMPLAAREPLEVTRTRAVLVVGPVTSQTKLPLVAPPSGRVASVSYVPPPSRLSSMRTVPATGRL